MLSISPEGTEQNLDFRWLKSAFDAKLWSSQQLSTFCCTSTLVLLVQEFLKSTHITITLNFKSFYPSVFCYIKSQPKFKKKNDESSYVFVYKDMNNQVSLCILCGLMDSDRSFSPISSSADAGDEGVQETGHDSVFYGSDL